MREFVSLRKILTCGITFLILIVILTSFNGSNVIWKSITPPQPQVKDSKATCTINWDDPRHIDSSEYELKGKPRLPTDSKGRFSKPIRVKPIYPNPVIKLRPDYFVLAVLQNGPNNQLVGFREVIFLAVKLNRTVVIPRFIKHHTDK